MVGPLRRGLPNCRFCDSARTRSDAVPDVSPESVIATGVKLMAVSQVSSVSETVTFRRLSTSRGRNCRAARSRSSSLRWARRVSSVRRRSTVSLRRTCSSDSNLASWVLASKAGASQKKPATPIADRARTALTRRHPRPWRFPELPASWRASNTFSPSATRKRRTVTPISASLRRSAARSAFFATYCVAMMDCPLIRSGPSVQTAASSGIGVLRFRSSLARASSFVRAFFGASILRFRTM